jgi:ABC-2 type transport system ATP-binding protein
VRGGPMLQTIQAAAEACDPVVVKGLVKTYPNGAQAVRGISFRVHQGEVFGLLGPNGAGKTTTLGVLTTLVRPSGGTASVGGQDVLADPVAARQSIGVVFQDSVLDNDFSGAANLWLHARLWRVPDAAARIASLLAAVELGERASDSVRTYSGGMRRRLEIARALLGRPSVLFLDEPTLGLDPIVRQELWHMIAVLREREQVTVLLSTHYLEEAQTVCDRVAIIYRGGIIALDTPARLIELAGRHAVDLRVAGDPGALLSALEQLEPPLGKPIHVGSTVSVASNDSPETLTERVNTLAPSRLGMQSLTVRPTTLNDVFLILTSSRAQRENAAVVAAGAAR